VHKCRVGICVQLRQVAEDRDAFVYFNNDAEGYAVRDAQELRRWIENQS